MKIVARWMVSLLVMTLLGLSSAQAEIITLLHVNDTHSHLEAIGPKDHNLNGTLGGLTKAATVIRALQASAVNPVLIHAGDLFQGDIYFNGTFGVAEWRILDWLGLAAAAVGNHEFYLGPQALSGALAQAFPNGGSPLLSANLDLSRFPELSYWIGSHTIREVGGLRVGFFGLTTPFDPGAQPDPVQILGGDLSSLVEITTGQVRSLRTQGVDVVVCLSHLGLNLDRFLASTVPGIDAIVGGHDHRVLPQPEMVIDPSGRPVPVVQAGEFYEYVGELRLEVEPGGVALAGYRLVPVDAQVARQPEVVAQVEQIQAQLTARYGDLFHHPLAVALADVSPVADPRCPVRDTGMGNLLADALRWRTRTDLGLTVNGFIPEGLTRGWVVGADVFRTVSDGFDPTTGLGFRLFTLEITGAELAKALEAALEIQQVSGSDDMFVQVSGMRYEYDSTRPAGRRLLRVSVRGRRLDPARTYTATVNQGVVVGLPLLGVNVSRLTDTGDNEYLAVRDYLAHLRLVFYFPTGRIRDRAKFPR